MHFTSVLKSLSALSLAALLTACAGGSVLGHKAPTLQAYHWDLSNNLNGKGVSEMYWRLPGQRLPRLNFEQDTVALHNLCSVLTAPFKLEGEHLKLGAMAQTKAACPDIGRAMMEQTIAAQLAKVQRYELRPGAGASAPLLVLHLEDGRRWELTGTPTPQTRYGSAGERVFLEVAPDRVPCAQTAMTTATAAGPAGASEQCLRVREVHFGDNGVRQGEGEWQPLQGEIEGYTHEAGTRSVLRLTRFEPKQVPAGGAAQAHVLDMVVESEPKAQAKP